MRFRCAPLPFLVVLSLCIGAQAQTGLTKDQTLAGLPGIHVLVEGMAPDAERDGLTTSAIQTAVELRLRRYGIKVLTQEEQLALVRTPYLYVNVTTVKNESGLYAFFVRTEVSQRLQFLGTELTASVVTWTVPGAIGMVRANNLRNLKDTVREKVDEFINAFLAQNPKE